jgi:acetyl-CoA carboxylase biotin carboxyl carrier protein
MDFKQIQELIKMINKSNIGEVSIEEDGKKVTIKQKKDPAPVYMGSVAQAPVNNSIPAPLITTQADNAKNLALVQTAEKTASNLITIKSPMIGTFYRRPSPDKPLFVEVGSEVKIGKVVCIIEAMKLFNEIESEVNGKIVKILVEDNTPVEYDQPLYLLEPA